MINTIFLFIYILRNENKKSYDLTGNVILLIFCCSDLFTLKA